jgi:hypothetical protein
VAALLVLPSLGGYGVARGGCGGNGGSGDSSSSSSPWRQHATVTFTVSVTGSTTN